MTKEQLPAMSADDYMNADQPAFFTGLLQSMKVETHERIELSRATIEGLDTPSDPADVARRSKKSVAGWSMPSTATSACCLSWKWRWTVSPTRASAGAMTAVSQLA